MFSHADLLMVFAIALAGGSLGKLAKIPGGTLLAATASVAAFGFYRDIPRTPPYIIILMVQILTGCMLGQSINRRFWQDFLQIWRPALTVIFLFTLLAIPFTFFLILHAGFESVTAVLAATPARMQDMIVLASTTGSDAVTVMLMQFARQFSIILITPFMLAQYTDQNKKNKNTGATPSGKKRSLPLFCKTDAISYGILAVPSIIGATLGKASGHLLGPLLGAFFVVALSRVIWLKAGEVPFPKPFAFLIQCLAGILLGTRITPDTAGLFVDRLIPLGLACFYVLAGGLVIARILHKRYGWHKGLSWMSAAPGRAADMLAMSQDIDLSGRERLALVCVHTVRLVYFMLLISTVMVFF